MMLLNTIINNLSNKLVTYLANLPDICMGILFYYVAQHLPVPGFYINNAAFFFFKLAICKSIYQTIFETLLIKYMTWASNL